MTETETDTDTEAEAAAKPTRKRRKKTSSPLDALDTFTDNDEAVDYMRGIYYSEPGVGKTIAAAHVINHADRVLWIEAEPGVKKRAWAEWGLSFDKIVRVKASKISYDNLHTYFGVIEEEVERGTKWAIVVDTVTNMESLILTQAVDSEVAKNPGRKGDKTKPQLSDYGITTEQLRRLFRQAASIDCHLIITAHTRIGVDQDGDPTGEIVPATMAKFGESLFGLVDWVIYMANKNGARIGYLVPTTNRRAKDRDGVLPPVFPNPNVDRIAKYLSGELTVKNDPDYKAFAKENPRVIAREAKRVGRKPNKPTESREQ